MIGFAFFSGHTDKCDVRFTPESGQTRARSDCPLGANSGHTAIHLITSSASSKNNSRIENARLGRFEIDDEFELVR